MCVAGEFGTVYRAVWKDQGAKKQVEVAVKTLKVRNIIVCYGWWVRFVGNFRLLYYIYW